MKTATNLKLRCCLLIVLLIGNNFAIKAGDVQGLDTIRIDQQKLFVKLTRLALLYVDSTRSIVPRQLDNIDFKDTINESFKVSSRLVQKDLYLKFIVSNQADSTISFYFFPGVFYEIIELFQQKKPGADIEKVREFPDETTGYSKLKLQPGQAVAYFAKLKFVKTNTNNFNPVLIRDYFLKNHILGYQNSDREINIITFVFAGILLMMIFYSIAVYILNRNIEFLYYAGYALCMCLMFFLKSYLFKTPSSFNNFFEAYLDFVLQSLGTFIYLAFLRTFIDTKKHFAWLHKMLLVEQSAIIVSIALFSYLYFDSDNYVLQNSVENISKYIWILGAIIFIIYTVRIKNKLLNYLAAGHSFLLLGGLASLYLISSRSNIVLEEYLHPLFNNALLYYELGLAAELMFFLTALAFKNKTDIVERTKERERLKLRTEMQDFEKQLAVLSAQQDERNRISADMHDELGSGATIISLTSEILKTKMKDQVFPEIDKISNTANELITKMNTLIWTMKSENDSIESLVTYVRIYALEFFENTQIECRVNMPSSFPIIELSGEKRRNIFLTVKESLNNVMKHSLAGKVTISFLITNKLIISIVDDGIGIDFNKLRQFGNGLNNIKKRIEGIDGIYKIENNKDKGVRTTVELKL